MSDCVCVKCGKGQSNADVVCTGCARTPDAAYMEGFEAGKRAILDAAGSARVERDPRDERAMEIIRNAAAVLDQPSQVLMPEEDK